MSYQYDQDVSEEFRLSAREIDEMIHTQVEGVGASPIERWIRLLWAKATVYVESGATVYGTFEFDAQGFSLKDLAVGLKDEILHEVRRRLSWTESWMVTDDTRTLNKVVPDLDGVSEALMGPWGVTPPWYTYAEANLALSDCDSEAEQVVPKKAKKPKKQKKSKKVVQKKTMRQAVAECEAEAKARKELIEEGCPLHYSSKHGFPPNLDTMSNRERGLYQWFGFWNEESDRAFQSQLWNWKAFRQHQRAVRVSHERWQQFEDDVLYRLDKGQIGGEDRDFYFERNMEDQSRLQTFTEYHVWHLERHEAILFSLEALLLRYEDAKDTLEKWKHGEEKEELEVDYDLSSEFWTRLPRIVKSRCSIMTLAMTWHTEVLDWMADQRDLMRNEHEGEDTDDEDFLASLPPPPPRPPKKQTELEALIADAGPSLSTSRRTRAKKQDNQTKKDDTKKTRSGRITKSTKAPASKTTTKKTAAVAQPVVQPASHSRVTRATAAASSKPVPAQVQKPTKTQTKKDTTKKTRGGRITKPTKAPASKATKTNKTITAQAQVQVPAVQAAVAQTSVQARVQAPVQDTLKRTRGGRVVKFPRRLGW